MKNLYFILAFFFISQTVTAQASIERSVQITADVTETSVTFSWVLNASATAYNVSLWEDNKWNILETLGATVDTWTYDQLEKGKSYEFRVVKFGGNLGYGYINTGYEVEPVGTRGRCLLLVDSVLTAPLSNEIERWVRDVEGDGWYVMQENISPNMDHFQVKSIINSWYDNNPDVDHNIFILGHVAVPYSGSIAPDGHGNHVGAWPCDGYYGDKDDGAWSDVSVNNVTASRGANHNVPGDGKFDQSIFPTVHEMGVGRADLSNLPAFPEDYIALTKKYMDKNHAFRTRQFDVKRRALVENNFASFGEGFGQNGWKNFVPMFGLDSVRRANYEVVLSTNDYLCSYACGAGSYTSMGGVGNTTTLYVDREIQTVFTMNFGSYFGDWDNSNNLMRSSLASGLVLTNAWAARPNWQFHQMALGGHIGSSARQSLNNNNIYVAGFSARGVHMGLLGDPTLRLHAMQPPTNLQVVEVDYGVELTWIASADATAGYQILRKEEGLQFYESIQDELIIGTTYVDSCLRANTTYHYLVQAIKLEESASGSYFNNSIGITNSITPIKDWLPTANFASQGNFEEVSFMNNATNANAYNWDFGNGSNSTEANPNQQFTKAGTYFVCLEVFGACGSKRYCDSVTVESSLPSVKLEVEHVRCYGERNGKITATVTGGLDPISLKWSNGQTTNMISDLGEGAYTLEYTSGNGTTANITGIMVNEPDSISVELTLTREVNGGDGTAKIDTLYGGTPGYSMSWDNGTADPTMLGQGSHTLTVEDSNGCVKVIEFDIDASNNLEDLAEYFSLYPNPAIDYLELTSKQDFDITNIWIVGMDGKSTSLSWQKGQTTKVMVGHLAKGIYALHISNAETTLISKVVKD